MDALEAQTRPGAAVRDGMRLDPTEKEAIRVVQLVARLLQRAQRSVVGPMAHFGSFEANGILKIVVEKLTKNVNEDHLREIFGAYGPIREVELPINRQFMTNRGTAYILYATPTASEAAIAHMHEAQLDGAVIHVSIVLPRRKFSRSPPPARRGGLPPFDSRREPHQNSYRATAPAPILAATALHHLDAARLQDGTRTEEGEEVETGKIRIGRDRGREAGAPEAGPALSGEGPGATRGVGAGHHHGEGAAGGGGTAREGEAGGGAARATVATAAIRGAGAGVEVDTEDGDEVGREIEAVSEDGGVNSGGSSGGKVAITMV
ncbi:hypothetical protein MMC13_005878 [Lambiella insularis]|nr:hypothetical protein [Lambiella insularis]